MPSDGSEPESVPDRRAGAPEVDEQTPDGGFVPVSAHAEPEPESATEPEAETAEARPNPKTAARKAVAPEPAPAPVAVPADDDDDPAPSLVWYVLKVQSSREDTIRDALERRVKIQGLQRYFGRIVVPTEKITEIRNNKKRIVERKTYPGYIMVEMELNEKTWFVVRETPGVGDFVGAHGTPTKMTEAEVNQMLGQETAKTEEAPRGPDRRRAGRPGQDQGRPVRELRGDRRGSHRGPRPGQGHADHLQPADAGGPRILAGGTDLIRSDVESDACTPDCRVRRDEGKRWPR